MADLIAAASSGGADSEASLSAASALGLKPDEVKVLVEQGVAWASAHGLQMAKTPVNFVHAPFSLLPIPYPRSEFEKGCALAPLFNTLYDKVSRDIDWLYEQIAPTLDEDKFTAALVRISKEVEAEGPTQRNYLGIFRSDYMLHEPEPAAGAKLLQVELNTIAASFASLGSITSEFHRFIVGRHAAHIPGVQEYLSLGGNPLETLDEALPANKALKNLPMAIMTAHKQYCSGAGSAPPPVPGQSSSAAAPIVVFVVQPGEVNTIDQRLLEHELWSTFKVKAVRKTMAEINATGELRGAERRLFVGGAEVAVCYFRAGYQPEDYPSDGEWAARLLMERSHAIKCPSIAHHLSGAKKVQQALAAPGALERFVSADEAAALRECFAGLYGLEEASVSSDEGARAAFEEAQQRPEGFVMKPQREGGGNNLYSEELAAALKSMPAAERAGYILMQRIFPRKRAAVLVREGRPVAGETISELGMYGVFLGDGERVHLNQHAGQLLRTKLEGVDEGGVATGYSVLSSVALYGESKM